MPEPERQRLRRPQPVAPLTDDVVEDILLCFPPDDPTPLFRAALVCKSWHRIICRPRFRRRFHELHRGAPAPLLGLIHLGRRFTLASTFRLPLSSWATVVSHSWDALDALHGRVLFADTDRMWPRQFVELVAWSPFAVGDEVVRRLPRLCLPKALHKWTATMLCAAAGCRHQDCSYGAFTVVLVHTNQTTDGSLTVYVYSSEQNVWSEPVCIHDGPGLYVESRTTTTLVGNVVYCPCLHERRIKLLGYDLRTQEISFVNLPASSPRRSSIVLTTTTAAGDEGERLGLAMAWDGKIMTWSRKTPAAGGAGAGLVVGSSEDGDDEWTEERVFELHNMLPSWVFSVRHLITPATGNNSGVFIVTAAQGVLFAIDLKTGGVTKRLEHTADSSSTYIEDVVPYRCFCIPQFDCAAADHY